MEIAFARAKDADLISREKSTLRDYRQKILEFLIKVRATNDALTANEPTSWQELFISTYLARFWWYAAYSFFCSMKYFWFCSHFTFSLYRAVFKTQIVTYLGDFASKIDFLKSFLTISGTFFANFSKTACRIGLKIVPEPLFESWHHFAAMFLSVLWLRLFQKTLFAFFEPID